MSHLRHPIRPPSSTGVHDTSAPSAIDARQVAELYGCSARTVQRLAEAGAIPSGFRLGRLRRWNLLAIVDHIAAGCPPISNTEEDQ